MGSASSSPEAATPVPGRRRKWILALLVILLVVVAVAIGASLSPPGPAEDEEGPPEGQSWRPVATFDGTGNDETEVFNVTGSKLRLTWAVAEADCPYVPDICETFLQFRLFRAGTTSEFLKHVVIGRDYAPLTGEMEVEASGDFYVLVFSAVYVDSWTITAEEWR